MITATNTLVILPIPNIVESLIRVVFSRAAKPAESRHIIMPLDVAIAAETPGTPALMPFCNIDFKLSDNTLSSSPSCLHI